MYSYLFKLIMFSNSIFIIGIGLYIIFSKKNEPNDYPDEYSKLYTLKPKKNFDKF